VQRHASTTIHSADTRPGTDIDLARQDRTWARGIPAWVCPKQLKNVGPIRHCEPPHAHSPGVAASRLRIDVHDDNDNA